MPNTPDRHERKDLDPAQQSAARASATVTPGSAPAPAPAAPVQQPPAPAVPVQPPIVPVPAPIPVIYVDADPFNADWAKRTWDLDVHSAEELRAFLDSIGMTVAQFKRLPIYVWHVDDEDKPWLKDL